MGSRLPRLALLALGCASGAANATFISGALAFSGGLTELELDHHSIVSELDVIRFHDLDPHMPGTQTLVTGASLAFGGLNGVGGDFADFDTSTPFWTMDVGPYSFTLEDVSRVMVQSFRCVQELCQDSLTLRLTGEVTAPGVDTMRFLGNLGMEGACIGNEQDGCLSNIVGSYSGTLVAKTLPNIPNPGTLLLLGAGALGFAGVRWARREAGSG